MLHFLKSKYLLGRGVVPIMVNTRMLSPKGLYYFMSCCTEKGKENYNLLNKKELMVDLRGHSKEK